MGGERKGRKQEGGLVSSGHGRGAAPVSSPCELLIYSPVSKDYEAP